MTDQKQKRIYLSVSLLGVCILITTVALLALTVYNDRNQSIGNSAANLEHLGLVAESKNGIYAVKSDGGANGLYRMNSDLTESQLLYNGNCSNVNVVNGWVYFILTSSTNQHLLFKIPEEGGKAVLLRENAYKIMVVDDWIYVEDCHDNAIVKIKTDGSLETTLVKGYCSLLDVRGNLIYYKLYDDKTDTFRLYRIRTDGTENEKLINTISNLLIQRDWLYQIDYMASSDTLGYLQKSRLGSKYFSYLEGVRCESFFIDDDWIYYSNNEGTYKIKTNGTKNTKISNKTFLYMNSAADWLFFVTDEEYTGMVGDTYILYKMRPDGTDCTPVWPD